LEGLDVLFETNYFILVQIWNFYYCSIAGILGFYGITGFGGGLQSLSTSS